MKCKHWKENFKTVNENKIKNMCEKAGVIYRGIQRDLHYTPLLVLFDACNGGTTLAIKVGEISYGAIIKKLKERGLR